MRSKAKSKVAELRKKAGLTQAQLAVFIGVTPNTIQNWEKDCGLEQLEKYLKLCEVLGCELSDLIEYVETEEEEAKAKGFSLEELRELRKRWGTDVKKPEKIHQTSSKHQLF
jgi:DNA-binding XRE family transcriptional regulator